MNALWKTGLEFLEQRRESLCESFCKKIQYPKHKLHHVLPEMYEVQSNLRKVRPREPIKSKTKHFQNSPINYCRHKFQYSKIYFYSIFILLLSRKNWAQMKNVHDSSLPQQEFARISKFSHSSSFFSRFGIVRLGH